MRYAVTFRGKDFILDDDWSFDDAKELVADTLNLEVLKGSFGITFHDNGSFIEDITFKETYTKVLPFNGAKGVHETWPFPIGEVYFFTGFPTGHDEKIVVLYENEREMCPPQNEVRFPLKEHSNENKGSKGQGELF